MRQTQSKMLKLGSSFYRHVTQPGSADLGHCGGRMAIRGPDPFQPCLHVLGGSPPPSGPGEAPGAWAAGPSKGARKADFSRQRNSRDVAQPAVRKGRRSALPRPCARLMGLVGRRGGGVPGWAPIVSATAPSVSQITFYTCQGGSSSQLRGCVRHLVTPSKQRGGLGACPGVALEPVLGWPQSLFWCGLR